jgi:Rrf2 family protein
MLSQTAEYALRAVLYLAEQPHGRPVRVDEIGDALGIPANYLSKTLATLVRLRILASLRGPHGGFRLAVAPEDLPLMQVVAPFDDIAARRHCLLGNPECSDQHSCAAHHAWKRTSEQVEHFFRTTTVAAIRRVPAAPAPRARRGAATTSRSRRTA